MAKTCEEIENEMFDWMAGRRSWWNTYAQASSGGTSTDHTVALAMCSIADAMEVVKRAAILRSGVARGQAQ